MDELKFVLASNDGINLTSKHFGDAEKYYLFRIFKDGTVELDYSIENKFKDVDESTAHGSKEKRQSIISYLGDSLDFIVASQMSPNFRQINAKTKVCPIVSKITNIEEVLVYLKDNYSKLVEIKNAKLENKETEIVNIKKEENKMDKFDLLIIGGGPAAITIAKTIQDKMKVAIIRPEDHSMVYCAMPYVVEELLSFEKTLKKDVIVTEAKAELIRDMAVSVDFDNKTVTTRENGTISYGKLIIATGASPILPPIKGHDLSNVMTFKTEYDLERVIGLVDKGLKKAVVIGAGAIGIELAQALNKRKVETHLVDMAESVLPNMSDYEMIKDAQESLIKSGINLHLKAKVEALEGDIAVKSVTLGDNQSISFGDLDNCTEVEELHSAGLVVFAVGMRPTVEIFKDTKLAIERDGIVINNRMETNIPDVYAIGDCCEFISGITGEVLSGKLATNAVPMGRVLAYNLLGQNREYPGFFNGAATKINNFFIGGTGFSEKFAKKHFDVEVGYAEFTTAFPIMPSAKKVKFKLIVNKETHKIVGGQFVSGEPVADKVDKITMAIQFGLTVEQLTSFSYSSQPYQSFYPAHNLIVKAAEEVLKKLQ